MKKINLLLTSIMVVFCLVGCSNQTEHIINYDTNNTNGLAVLCSHELGQSTTITFIRDTYTDNVYIKYYEKHGYNGGGSLSPYYNADGKIMSYTEFRQVHKHYEENGNINTVNFIIGGKLEVINYDCKTKI